jgi:hypothetical protein
MAAGVIAAEPYWHKPPLQRPGTRWTWRCPPHHRPHNCRDELISAAIGFVSSRRLAVVDGSFPQKETPTASRSVQRAAPFSMHGIPAKDEAEGNQCKGYGAGAISRLPTRAHVTWQDPNVMKWETDQGMQTRLFRFGHCGSGAQANPGAQSWQGLSVATWEPTAGGGGRGGGPVRISRPELEPDYPVLDYPPPLQRPRWRCSS